MTTIDLDAAKAARAEARGDAVADVVFGGERFALPAEIPASILDGVAAAGTGDIAGIRRAIDALLGPDEGARFYALGPSLDDLLALLTAAVEASGLGGDLGESSASASSS